MGRLRGVKWVGLASLAGGLAVFAWACQPAGRQAETSATSADSARVAAASGRGQQQYLAYCAMCHGTWGEGDGPLAAELKQQSGAAPAALNDPERLARLGRQGVVNVITLGGAGTHRSNLMPPWGKRLPRRSIEDIADFVMSMPERKPGIPNSTIAKYMEAPPGTPAEGRKLFVFYCTMCHGPYGKGDGTLADTLSAHYGVRPRDLTDTAYFEDKTDRELYETVSLGGRYTGHSEVMPAWAVKLTPAEIKNLVSYVRELSNTASRP